MSFQPILRFAPSPNGLLHLGHAFSALFTCQAAARLKGVVLLRIEDIDLERCKPEFDLAILDDLAWLGLSWPEPVLRQSSRFAAYAQAIGDLRSRQLLYPCFCSRKQIAEAATHTDPDGAPLYPGICRHLSKDEAERRLAEGDKAQWRIDMTMATAIHEELTINEFSGENVSSRIAAPQLWGDAVLVRKDTPTSYHLSVVVDDAYQQVTHVTRGMDLYAATDLHVLLQALLQLASPLYCHHDLVRDDAASKLSKSRGSPSLQSLRDAGETAADIRQRLGF